MQVLKWPCHHYRRAAWLPNFDIESCLWRSVRLQRPIHHPISVVYSGKSAVEFLRPCRHVQYGLSFIRSARTAAHALTIQGTKPATQQSKYVRSQCGECRLACNYWLRNPIHEHGRSTYSFCIYLPSQCLPDLSYGGTVQHFQSTRTQATPAKKAIHQYRPQSDGPSEAKSRRRRESRIHVF